MRNPKVGIKVIFLSFRHDGKAILDERIDEIIAVDTKENKIRIDDPPVSSWWFENDESVVEVIEV